jgi:hypothetical protein
LSVALLAVVLTFAFAQDAALAGEPQLPVALVAQQDPGPAGESSPSDRPLPQTLPPTQESASDLPPAKTCQPACSPCRPVRRFCRPLFGLLRRCR